MRAPFTRSLLAFLALATLAPSAAATEVTGAVYVHDLTENGAYQGCHVTDTNFVTFRLTVHQGDAVKLFASAPDTNTNAHTLSVEKHAAKSKLLTKGQSDTVAFTAGAPGSYAVLCDETGGQLQGILIVQKAAVATSGGSGVVAPGLVAALAALVGSALIARRLT